MIRVLSAVVMRVFNCTSTMMTWWRWCLQQLNLAMNVSVPAAESVEVPGRIAPRDSGFSDAAVEYPLSHHNWLQCRTASPVDAACAHWLRVYCIKQSTGIRRSSLTRLYVMWNQKWLSRLRHCRLENRSNHNPLSTENSLYCSVDLPCHTIFV